MCLSESLFSYLLIFSLLLTVCSCLWRFCWQLVLTRFTDRIEELFGLESRYNLAHALPMLMNVTSASRGLAAKSVSFRSRTRSIDRATAAWRSVFLPDSVSVCARGSGSNNLGCHFWSHPVRISMAFFFFQNLKFISDTWCTSMESNKIYSAKI